jgi:hypothetical protein
MGIGTALFALALTLAYNRSGHVPTHHPTPDTPTSAEAS